MIQLLFAFVSLPSGCAARNRVRSPVSDRRIGVVSGFCIPMYASCTARGSPGASPVSCPSPTAAPTNDRAVLRPARAASSASPTSLRNAVPYAGALRSYLTRVTSQLAGNAQPAAEVADTIVALLSATEPPFRMQTSDWAQQFVATKLADVDGSAVQALTTPWITA